jgi:hypothetical protein
MITKYCYYDWSGKCCCAKSGLMKIDLSTCETCKEYTPDEDFVNDDQRVIEYKGE